MNDRFYQQLPLYRKIEVSLKEYIVRNKLKRHDRLPSESQLAEEHRASVGTIRKALNNLVSEKIIYRRHGQGTFVAPRIRKGKVLIIPPNANLIWPYDDYFGFFLGALSCANREDLDYEPVIVELDDFLANIDDATMVYPEIAGVIFFRGHRNLEKVKPALESQNLPFLFYGPNVYEADPSYPCIFHDEPAIAELLAGEFVKAKIKHVAILGNWDGLLIHDARAARMEKELGKRGIKSMRLSSGLLAQPEELRRKLAGAELLYSPVDALAIEAIQVLERDLKLVVPKDIAVVGIDNITPGAVLRPKLSTVDLCNRENGEFAIRRFAEYLAGHERKPFRLSAATRLIRRDTF